MFRFTDCHARRLLFHARGSVGHEDPPGASCGGVIVTQAKRFAMRATSGTRQGFGFGSQSTDARLGPVR